MYVVVVLCVLGIFIQFSSFCSIYKECYPIIDVVYQIRFKEPETPATPDDATGNLNREFAFVSPPVVKNINEIGANDSQNVIFYIKSSTTGKRGININVTYQVQDASNQFECKLEEKLDLETVEPFLIGSELLRYVRYVISLVRKTLKVCPMFFATLKDPKDHCSRKFRTYGVYVAEVICMKPFGEFSLHIYTHTMLKRQFIFIFLFSLYIFSCRTQQKLDTAYSDEPFLLVPEIKALSNHSVRILNTSVEVRSPMRLLNGSFSQLVGSTLYKDSIANECYAIQVKKQDLASSRY